MGIRNNSGTGILPVRCTGWKPVPPKAAGTEARPTDLAQFRMNQGIMSYYMGVGGKGLATAQRGRTQYYCVKC